MGLSYNPSSFATNKTILQAIEELKRYLMANPLACIYELSGNADPNVLTYSLSSVIVPDGQELKDGDILLSDNGYYAFIDEVGENDVTVLQWTLVGSHITSMTLTSSVVSVESTPTYLTGWIYRANAWTSDRYRILSYYLTLTYEDESMFPSTQVQSFTLPLQSINAIWYYLESDNSTTIYVDVNKDDGTNEVNSFSIPAGVPGQDGADGQNGVSITNVSINASNHLICTLSNGNTVDAGLLPSPVITADSINSETATSGQVLTADGDGGCSWDTISTGYTHTVAISTTSGTFSDSDFAKLGYGDSTIVYTDSYSVSTVYKLKLETASILEFEALDAASRNNLKLIDVNKTTKAYSMTAISMITSSTISSGSATAGKVLTANGSGGTSWETAGGGTTLNKYTYSIPLNANLTTTFTNIFNIVKNAKGHIENTNILCQINNLNRGFPVYEINTSGNIYFITRVNSESKTYIYYLQWQNLTITSASHVIVIDETTNTISNSAVTSFSFRASDIVYYNDTQLH